MAILTRLIGALNSAGRPGRELGVRLDMLRSTGVRYALQRRREEERLTALAPDPRQVRLPGDLAGGGRRGRRRAVGAVGRVLRARATNGARARVWRHWVPLDDAVTLRLALDKLAVHEMLTARRPAAARAPRVRRVASWTAPSTSSTRTGSACVVKPTGGASGSGTTTGVRTPRPAAAGAPARRAASAGAC